MTTGNEQGQSQPQPKEETALEKEARDWTARQQIAEAKQAIAVAEKGKLQTTLPFGTTQPAEGTTPAAEGKVTIAESSGYVAELAAYNAMRHLAKDIAQSIQTKGGQNIKGILLTDSLDYSYTNVQSAHMSLQVGSFERLIDNQKTKVGAMIKPKVREEILAGVAPPLTKTFAFMTSIAASTALEEAPKLVEAIAGVIGYFRMDYEVKGRVINKSDEAFRAMVASYIKPPVYLPEFHNIDINNSTILKALGKTISKRNELQLMIAQLAKTFTPLATAKPEAAKPSPNELLYTESVTLVKEFDEFVKTITSIAEGKPHSPLTNAVIREHISDYMKKKAISHLLYLTITSVGGEQVTRSGLFNIGAKIWYLGGCVVSYTLAELEGKIIATDTISGSAHVLYKLGKNHLSDFTAVAHQ